MKADILLLRPTGKKTDSRLFAMEQLGLSYIAAVARLNGLSTEIVDGFLQPGRYNSVLTETQSSDYRLIGYPVYHETVQRVAYDASLMRRRGVTTHITIGNYLATLCGKTILQDFPWFDSAVRGEGEATVSDLARQIATGGDLSTVLGLTYRRGADIVTNPPRRNAPDLDCLPFPVRDTLPLVLAAGNAPLIYSSRGCNCRCEFCSVHKFYRSSGSGHWRARSPKNVVDEMEQIADEFGVKEFAFADEQFMGHGRTGVDRALGIAEELLKRGLAFHWYIETRSSDVSLPVFAKLREAGLRAVFMGLESGHDAALRALRKGLSVAQHLNAIAILKDLEILPTIGFIMFRPDTSIEELEANLAILEEIGCGEITALVTQLKVYGGTDLEQSLRKNRQLEGSYLSYAWTFKDPSVAICYRVLMDVAGLLSVCYNAFARVRRLGLLTYNEALQLQRVMNAGPIAVTKEVIKEVASATFVVEDLIGRSRRKFEEKCEDFLRLLRFTEVMVHTRHHMDNPLRLLNPMSLC